MEPLNPDGILNDSQRRSVSLALSLLEEYLHGVEQLIQKDDYAGILYKIENDIPLAIRNELIAKIVLIKKRIRILAEKFSLEKMIKKNEPADLCTTVLQLGVP